MAESKPATDSSEQNPIAALDDKTRSWLEQMLPLLGGQPGASLPGGSKPDVLAFTDLTKIGQPQAAPAKDVDLLTAAIKAKDAHRVQQYVTLILINGHHLGGTDSNGEYPIHLAVQTNDHIIVSLVVQTNTNIKNAAGETPLIMATKLGNLKIVEMLLKNHANVTHTDKKSKTALDYAVEKLKADPANKDLAKICELLEKEMKLMTEPDPEPPKPKK